VIPYTHCLMYHWCMCGHRAHEENNQILDEVADYSAFFLFSLALILSLGIKEKKNTFYICMLLTVLLGTAGLSIIALVPFLFGLISLVKLKTHPDDADNPDNPPENSKNQLDD